VDTHPDHEQPDHDHDHDHDGRDHRGHDHHGHDHPEQTGGLRALIASLVSPHSHDTSEAIASALAATDEGVRALKLSLAALGITAAVQLAIVIISGSVALLSDTIHNFADALTALPLGVAFWMGRRPPTKRYTYGYGRAEDLAGIFIVAIIAASSALAAWEAITRLEHPHSVKSLPWVAVAGLIGFAGNESVAAYRIRVGRRIGSATLIADGVHARTDGLTSLAVVIGAAGVAAGWRDADPAVGLAITAVIVLVLKNAARDIYRRLMDSVDPDLVDEVEKVLAAIPGVEGVDRVRLRWVGHELWAEAEISCPSQLPISSGHALAEEAFHRLLHDIPRLSQATIHTNPSHLDGTDYHNVTAHHFPAGT
jgi:cation diffusion facilitator family transporter